MSVAARLVHATAGRARLRVPAAKGDARFFARVKEELRRSAAVRDVKVNALTGSVLVRHSGDFDAVARHAQAHDLFDVEDSHADGDGMRASKPEARVTEHLRAFVVGAADALRRKTKGAVDLRVVTVGALLGGSVYQLVCGNFLPAGGTMLAQAASVLFGRVESDE